MWLAIAVGTTSLIASPSRAQLSAPPSTTFKMPKVATSPFPPDGKLPNRDKLNANTVTIITAPVGGAWAPMGSDMARVLDDGENLRILPIIGRGSVQNLVDVMLLKGVDMGLAVSDSLEFFTKEYQVPNVRQRVAYIVPLYTNDLHIVARKDIKTIRDLAGKKIMSERNLGTSQLSTALIV